MLSPQKLRTDRRLKYLLVVIVGFSVDFSVYALLVSGGLSPYIANILAFLVGGSVNLWAIRKWVFTEPRLSFFPDLGRTFVSNGGIVLGGNLLIWLFVEMFGMNVYLAKFVSNSITFVINYWARKFVFSRS